MAVDTHVFRVSHRLGLSDAKNVEKTEADLVKHRLDAQKNKNKVKEPKTDNEKARFENWSYREKKAAELLDTKFKK
jgi:hypothetical protein